MERQAARPRLAKLCSRVRGGLGSSKRRCSSSRGGSSHRHRGCTSRSRRYRYRRFRYRYCNAARASGRHRTTCARALATTTAAARITSGIEHGRKPARAIGPHPSRMAIGWRSGVPPISQGKAIGAADPVTARVQGTATDTRITTGIEHGRKRARASGPASDGRSSFDRKPRPLGSRWLERGRWRPRRRGRPLLQVGRLLLGRLLLGRLARVGPRPRNAG